MAETAAEMAAPAGPPSLGQIFLAFAKIGLTSFGGGLSGWMLREFVQNRRWVFEADFLNGLARLWARYRGAPWQRAVETGLAPVAAGMVLAASFTLLQAAEGGWPGPWPRSPACPCCSPGSARSCCWGPGPRCSCWSSPKHPGHDAGAVAKLPELR